MKEKNNNNQNQNQSTQIIATVLAIAILIVAVVGISFAAFTYSRAGEKENSITTGTITMVYSEDSKGVYITDATPTTDTIGRTIEATDAKGAGKVSGNDPKLNEDNDGNGVFKFSVAATIAGSTTINYDVIAKKDESSDEELEGYAKIYVTKHEGSAESYEAVRPAEATGDDTVAVYSGLTDASSGATTDAGKASGGKVLATGTFGSTRTDYFELRMWLAHDYGSTDSEGESFANPKTFKITVDVYGQAAE